MWDSFEGRVRIFNAPQSFDDPPVGKAQDLLLEDVVLRQDQVIAEELPPIERFGTVREEEHDGIWHQLNAFFARDYRAKARGAHD